jgi:signal transduction histidine kinase
MVPFSALAEVRQALGLIDASFRHDRISLLIETMPDLQLLGHPNEYAQVLLNLLTNARQAIQTSGTAAGRVTLRLEPRDGFGCLLVRDNGGGIQREILSKIFEPYFSTREGGSGIGLYISRQIAERSMGGRLEASNVEGGAEFRLFIPLAPRTG